MKPQLLFCTMASLAAIIFITSCTKEIQRPSSDHHDASANQKNSSDLKQQQQKILNLVTSKWVKNADGSYVNVFNGVMQFGGGLSPVKVYLVDQNTQKLISSAAITYMNGQLWSSLASPDIKIFFRPGSGRTLSFTSLNIRVIFG